MIAETFPPARQSAPGSTPVPVASDEIFLVEQPEILDAESLHERYQHLRSESEKLVEQGRLQVALDYLQQAAEVADEIGDEELSAMARCNVAFVAIALGETRGYIGDLRSVLMRNFGAETSFAAAYNLSCAYENLKEYKKSLFYGRIARDRAEAAQSDELLAKSLNQIGNGLVGNSYFQQAVHHYHRSIALMPSRRDGMSMLTRINGAYCLIVLGQTHEGMGQLFSALRWLKNREQLPVYQTWAHIFLCCGYLELGRVRRAWLHGMRAKALAESTGESNTLKSSLFMLGEVERFAGDTGASYEWFAELQRRFYPDDPAMPDLLSVVGVTRVVNLRA